MTSRLRSTTASLRRLVAQAVVPLEGMGEEGAGGELDQLVALPGEIVGDRFRIVELVGSGGMGLVYRSYDPETERDVAVKVCRSGRSRDDSRFEREIAILSRLVHPRIVRYIAHGRLERGGLWVAMDLLEGESLTDRLRGGALPTAEALVIGAQIADVLAAAHDAGVVHRDLKTSNIFMMAGDPLDVRLLDFGLARGSSEEALTAPGAWLGTPGYSAPEQIRDATTVDLRADLFALGVVLYECLTRRSPFPADDTAGALARTLMVPATPLAPSEAPRGLAELIDRLLEKEPSARPASAHVVAAALRRIAGVPAAAPPFALGERLGAGRGVAVHRAARLDRFATVRVERFEAAWLDNPLAAGELAAEARRTVGFASRTAWVPLEVVDLGTDLLLVLDDVDAAPLVALLARGRELPLGAAACIAEDVLAAVEAAHGQSPPLLHGGIDDDVVFVDRHGSAALGAFGPLRALEAGRASTAVTDVEVDADGAGEWCRGLLLRTVAGPLGAAAWKERRETAPLLAAIVADPIHQALSDPKAMRRALAPWVDLTGRAELAAWSRSAP